MFENDANMQRGVWYGPDTEGLMQSFVIQLGQNNQLLLANVQKMIEKSERENRKKRKRKVNEQISVTETGEIILLRLYDDGSREAFPFVINLTGEPKFYSVKFNDYSLPDDYCAVHFCCQDLWIFQKKRDISAGKLFQNFVLAGVKFNPAISSSVVKNLLFMSFGVRMQNAENTIEIPALAGWYNGKFWSEESLPNEYKGDMPLLPIMGKKFSHFQEEENLGKCYFREMRQITHWEDRLIIMLYPVAALMASLFADNSLPLEMGMNFVLLEAFPVKQLFMWCQIFNRDCCERLEGLSHTALQKEIAVRKDEVLLYDMRKYENDSYYQRSEPTKRFLSLLRYLEEGTLLAGMAGISNDILLQENIINLFVDDMFCKQDLSMTDSHAVGSFLFAFVKFVEQNIQKVSQKMREYRGSGNAGVFQVVLHFLNEFWKMEGIDFRKAADLPLKIDFAELLRKKQFLPDDLLDYFRLAMRESAKELFFENKKCFNHKEAVLYDTNFLWIPTELFGKILQSQGMAEYRSLILMQLRDAGKLETDGHGMSRRVQRAGSSSEYYKIERMFFSSFDVADIVDLGKENR